MTHSLALISPAESPPFETQTKQVLGVSIYSPLWLCIYFPKLALESLECNLEHNPCHAIFEDIAGRRFIHTVSAASQTTGIIPGMPLAAAYALCPHLKVHLRDPQAELLALKRRAAWAGQFTPTVSLEPPQALLLEIRGSLRLFGGLATLRRQIYDGLSVQGFHFCLTVAPTPLASLLLASHGEHTVVTQKEELRSVLGKLPISCLQLESHYLKRLTKAGIHELHDLWRLPRDGLARRFDPELLTYLDRALGKQLEARDVFCAPEHFEATLELPADISNTRLLLTAARRLLRSLVHYLRLKDAGTTRLQFSLHHAQPPSSRIDIGVRCSTRDEAHLLSLLAEHLNHLRLSAPVIGISLSSDHIHPFTTLTGTLFAHQQTASEPIRQNEKWQQVLEHLQARLGRRALHSLHALTDHRPERAWNYDHASISVSPSSQSNRPLWLLPHPQSLSSRKNHPRRYGQLVLMTDPERVEGGWWDGQDIRRDYYIAIDINGSRLWIFRDLQNDNAWYLHGLFG